LQEKIKHIVLLSLGWLNVALAIIGAILPVLPTTPFLLLAFYFFSRCRPDLAERIKQHPIYGSHIRAYIEGRGIRKRIKALALTIICLSFSLSIYLAPVIWVKCFLGGTAICVIIFILWQPTCPEDEQS